MSKKPKPKSKPKINRFVYWFPRVLSIVFILFLSMFALDIFDMNLGFWGTIVGLFMHLIPSFILIIVLLFAWRYELVGAIVFTLFALFYIAQLTATILMNPSDSLPWFVAITWSMTIAGPALLIGILYFVNWHLKKKK
jgi:hypothetical protein